MAERIILADNQVIFRTGMARVLALESDLEIVAQCGDAARMKDAILAHRHCVVVFPSSLTADLHGAIDCIIEAGSKTVLILEHKTSLDESITRRVEGLMPRSVAAAQLIDCLHRVAAGEQVVQHANIRSMPSPDRVGMRVLERLTPKEIQIVALVADGCKNREIATRLGTKEQVIKNYLRSIYDKTGVSDRLELALFTVHHRSLAEATDHARSLLVKIA